MCFRSEDKRVTNQLELAARKLTALKEIEDRALYLEDIPLDRLDMPETNGTL